MEIFNKYGTKITSLESWRDAFLEVDSKTHWKEGRSAYALAKLFNPQNTVGEETLRQSMRCIPDFDGDIKFDISIIEFESKFDNFRGNGRIHDLAIWGSCKGTKFFVGIEGKVDEPFGDTIKDAKSKATKYLNLKPTSKRLKRIENLEKQFLDNLNEYDESKIRYQLLHYLAGTLAQAQKSGVSIAIMPVLVFKTEDYNPDAANDNKTDYEKFMTALFGKQKDGSGLYSKQYGDVTIYSFYEEIGNIE